MLILASLSPRRRELLRVITEDFTAIAPEVDESTPPEMDPGDAVMEIAMRKAAHVHALYPQAAVIGADTAVALDGHMLGKPKNADDAVRMLKLLSGRVHHVHTGVAIVNTIKRRSFAQSTAVCFRTLEEQEIFDYVATGEPMDKAGAYGIQGKGALLVSGITGDYFNVVGLPLCALAQNLKNFS